MPSAIVAELQGPEPQALADLLVDSVSFHSPVADYQGRGDVTHLLLLIATILEDLRPTREVRTSSSCTTFLEAVVNDRPIEGVFDEHHDAVGRVVEATLMLRPLGALHTAVTAMAQALDEAPLPSQGR